MDQTLPQKLAEAHRPSAKAPAAADDARLMEELPPAVIVTGIGLSTALFLTTYYFLGLMAAMLAGLLLIIFMPAAALWIKRFVGGEYVTTINRWRAHWNYSVTYYAEKWKNPPRP
ncbi:hypothetical protein [Deinococcus ficus]|uniref:Uncharacterized protein n=1 Tax=Deinococcus ficus TaxID=317577 RepID=A0A221T356_9DEIO|nr:hypothetical protein [Deinococcus ficus]ASN83290.1 hypothetical protein DFI_19015 [Deinococcus ficus]